METEVLVVPGCPNEQTVADRLRRALADIGLRETGFTTRVIADQTEAERVGFAGSPTILVDGRDLFTEGRPPGLACRVYRTPTAFYDVVADAEVVEGSQEPADQTQLARRAT
ncbi:hypothetical protein ABZ519_25885 [Streptomyces collinus]|uniref:hypothetical protein n=1 Tax=Streptomyces collinus TaxID=42684 RepID=UPI003407DE80